MPNQLSFDVQFSRIQLEEILKDPTVTDVVVSGTYTYRPDLGQNVWEMKAAGEGVSSNTTSRGIAANATGPVIPCIKPCPGQ
jgi:hypothetical protein